MVEEGQEQRRETSLKAIAVAHEGSDGRLNVKKVADKTGKHDQTSEIFEDRADRICWWVGGW